MLALEINRSWFKLVLEINCSWFKLALTINHSWFKLAVAKINKHIFRTRLKYPELQPPAKCICKAYLSGVLLDQPNVPLLIAFELDGVVRLRLLRIFDCTASSVRVPQPGRGGIEISSFCNCPNQESVQ